MGFLIFGAGFFTGFVVMAIFYACKHGDLTERLMESECLNRMTLNCLASYLPSVQGYIKEHFKRWNRINNDQSTEIDIQACQPFPQGQGPAEDERLP